MISSRKSDNLAAGLSSKKLEAIKEISMLGLKLSDGYDYVLGNTYLQRQPLMM